MLKNDVIAAIGNTPLIRLKRASEATGCEILGKAEFLNPGQSVKDRAALFIIKDAIRRGWLHPGGTIVEGTAGNTGIGLATVANAMGFRTVIVIPDTQSQEKKDALRLLGAAIYSWIRFGKLESHGTSITEGIGQGRVTGNLEGAPIDDAYQVPDEEALPLIFDLLRHEGLCMGGSTGINVAGAIRMAKDMGPGHTSGWPRI